MAVEPDAATTDTAVGADACNTTSTLSSPPTDSSVNANEPPKEPPAKEDSFTAGNDQPATADGQCNDEDDAHADEKYGLARNLDHGTGASQYPRDSASEDSVTNGAHPEGLAVGSSELMQELRMLRDKVSEIEERTKKRPDYPILEAEWRTAREEVGIDGEQKFWEMFMKRRKEIADTFVKPDLDQPYTLELNDLAREMDADPVYENDVLRWRKNWERRLFPSKMWRHGKERYEEMMRLENIRMPSMHREDAGTRSPEDSDSDGSLDFELNLDRLRHRYLRKVDRLHEERDVRRIQSMVEARQRKNGKEKLAEEVLGAKSGHGAPAEKKSKDASVGIQRAKDTVEEPLRPTHAFSKLNRVHWIAFNSLRDIPEEESFAIDILLGEPDIGFGFSRGESRRRNAKQDGRKKDTPQEMSIQTKQPAELTGQSPLPERIRIHSTQLIRILNKVHGESIGSDGPLIMIRPYRFLIHYDEALRKWYRKLEKKFGSADASMSDSEGMPKSIQSLTTGANEPDGPSLVENRDDPLKQEALNGEPAAEAYSEDSEEENPEETKQDDASISRTALKHLRCLLEFMDADLSRKLTHLRNGASHRVSFSDIWHLFKPGDDVITGEGKQVYRVISVTSAPHKGVSWSRLYWTQSSASTDTPITISCTYVDFDGKRLGPVQKKFVIKRFDNEKAVTSLEVYPFRFHVLKRGDIRIDGNKEKDLRESFIARGRKFVQVAAIRHMYYAGPALETREEIESQVVVDFELALSTEENQKKEWRPKIGDMISTGSSGLSGSSGSSNLSDGKKEKGPCKAECCRNQNIHNDDFVEKRRNEDYLSSLLPESRERLPSVAIFPRSLQATKTPENSLSDEDLLIMSYRVFGFVLRTRKWETLDLTYLSDIRRAGQDDEDVHEDRTAFGRLVLPDNHKKMVQSLIAQHFRDKESPESKDSQFDIIRGKGKGLILLLHGAPGVGKTSTAEGCAELFRKPLFQITCGDLGSTAAEVERALETNFALASRWGCILLLDEADVFLSRRDPKDFKRNGLVAVFLRVLEYYAGILFLTTNRIGDFDEAFASRIHISLYYPPLDEDSTVKVFKLNLQLIKERMDEKDRELTIDTTRILSYARKYWRAHEKARWNGRQIRNACHTALALAEFEAQGGSHRAVQNPNAIVALGVGHISDVADSYLEFTNYLRELYGTDDSNRAKESGIRALDRKHEPDYHSARSNPLREFASRREATRRERFPQEESRRVNDHRIRTREPQYSGNQPRSGRRRHEPPVDVMESEHNYSDHEYQDDGPSPQASRILHAGRLRDPLDDEIDRRPRRRPQQGRDYSSSRQDLDLEDYEEERRSDVAYESPSEHLTSPSLSRAGRHQSSDLRSRRSNDGRSWQ